jgi:nitrogen fixation/metabolism regulation signal transduction histidine kinase
MVSPAMKSRWLLGPGPAIVLSIVFLVASLLLTPAVENEGLFGDYYTALVFVNVAGIVVMTVLTAINVYRLIGQFRAQVLGARLTLRFVATYALLAIIPLSLVYYFAVHFLSRGVDSWFDVKIEQALNDALLLGQTSLEATKEDVIIRLQRNAGELSGATSSFEIIQLLDELRVDGNFSEMSLHSLSGGVIASSSSEAISLVPSSPDDTVFNRIRQRKPYLQLEPMFDGGLQLRVAVPVIGVRMGDPLRLLQALYSLPLRYARLGKSVESASDEYNRLKYLRQPLKLNFVITLTLVTLMTMLIALWLAIYSTRRLVSPLRDLAEGTRAVASGDYRKQLPVQSGDELGVLVKSFNQMTDQIRMAQEAAARSQQQTEAQRTYLEIVLTHLSSGVLSLSSDNALRTHNSTAGSILSADLSEFEQRPIEQLGKSNSRLAPLSTGILRHIENDEPDWQDEIILTSRRGRQTLICRGTRLPATAETTSGYVIVFDDASALIQAQRDAAWGEVARRLAHEIKNPLTPIQLSAERIRAKYLGLLDGSEKETLDRATRTIAAQVALMQSLVNAFSQYAEPMQLTPVATDLNQLLQDILALHQQDARITTFDLDLEPDLPQVHIDPAGMRQVLNNLILNAADAMTGVENARLTLRTSRAEASNDSMIVLQVRDSGPGFPSDLLARIFDPYVTTKPKGTGLGLAIARRIIEEQGGRIQAENNPVGGALVIIELPLTSETNPESPREGAS